MSESPTEKQIEAAAKAIMRKQGNERFLRSPGLHNTQLWRRAKCYARAALLAAKEAGE
jgi:hypothetical protein